MRTEPDLRFTLLIQDMRSVTGTIPASAAWKWAVHLQQVIDSRAVHEPSLRVGFSTGRFFLEVNGVILAMEGDPCRDPNIASNTWTRELLEAAALPPAPVEPAARAGAEKEQA